MIGKTVEIEIEFGLGTKRIKATAIEYLGNLEQEHPIQPNTPLSEAEILNGR